jgi:hypothetical protein
MVLQMADGFVGMMVSLPTNFRVATEIGAQPLLRPSVPSVNEVVAFPFMTGKTSVRALAADVYAVSQF